MIAQGRLRPPYKFRAIGTNKQLLCLDAFRTPTPTRGTNLTAGGQLLSEAHSRYGQAHCPHQVPEAWVVAKWVDAGVNLEISHALVVRG
jgi:hypothetical protein